MIMESSTGYDVTELKVDSVLRGTHKKGDTIPVLGFYGLRKPASATPSLNSVPLDKGDQVIAFLTDTKSLRVHLHFNGEIVKQLVRGGVKGVVGGKVVEFRQWSNPGPFVLDTDVDRVKKSPSLEDFGRQVSETISRMTEIAAKLDAATASKDAQWFLQTLRERAELAHSAKKRRYYSDHLAALAAMRLADLHNPELLEQAFQYGTWQSNTLAKGFGTPAGRDYLLAAIQDTTQPHERRLRLAGVIEGAGCEYRSRLENIETGSCRIIGMVGVHNDDYITRIAKVVLDNIKNEELSLILVRGIDFFGRTIVQTKRSRDSRRFSASIGSIERGIPQVRLGSPPV